MPHRRSDDLKWAEMSIQEILEFAIADEEEARDYYRRAAEQAGSPHTRRTLLALSDMEQGHADTLRKELEEIRMQRDLETAMAD
jgi:rubrerythrin